MTWLHAVLILLVILVLATPPERSKTKSGSPYFPPGCREAAGSREAAPGPAAPPRSHRA